jgi:Na+-driven multidrug efflux pump
MRFLGYFVPLIILAFVFTQALFGAGNTVFVMWVEMSLHVLCLIPVSYLLAITFEIGFMGVWIAAAAYIVGLVVIMGWKFWEGKWKSIKL